MSKNGLLIFLIIIYILSPVDAIPGPIDDIALALIGLKSIKSDNQ